MTYDRNYYLENIPVPDAQAIIHRSLLGVGKAGPMAGETVPLKDALGRITAGPIWAKTSSPNFHSAAMDGFAVSAADTVNATETSPTLLLPDQLVPVNTGNALPPDKNAVIMIEHIQQTAEGFLIYQPAAPWQHVRMMGEDMVITELVLPANHKIRSVDLGALAGSGYAEIEVRRRPHVVIIPTGNELVLPGQEPAPGQIIEFNSLVLGGQIQETGGTVTVMSIQRDELDAIRLAMELALDHTPDMVLILSGSSAGSEDYTVNVIRELGQVLIHGIAVRPGHPVIYGIADQIPIFGVPGYPVSAALTGEMFITPVIKNWLGQVAEFSSRPRIKARITRRLVSPMGDDDYVRVTVTSIGGRHLATPLARGAGVISSLVKADGLAHIPRFSEGADMYDEVEVLLYRTLHEIELTLLITGSHDPMLDLLAQHLAVQFPGNRLTSANVGSMGGIIAVKRGLTHLAGTHLLDETSGEYNIAVVEKYLEGIPVEVITFAHREQGLMVHKSNPLGIRTIEDLPRSRFVNRQRGSGTRQLLDYQLTQSGISTDAIEGYEREEYTHLAVATAVSSGSADCGLGVRSAATALGLDFVSVGWERYDFVIPIAHRSNPIMAGLLDTLNSASFQRDLAEQPGYSTEETGRVQYRTGKL